MLYSMRCYLVGKEHKRFPVLSTVMLSSKSVTTAALT